MARCSSCNGLITKQDVVCYSCGDKLPKRDKLALALTTKSSSPWGNLMFGISLALPAFSLFSGYKLPLSVSLAISGLFLLLKLVGGGRKQKKPAAGYPKIPACFRGREANAIARRVAS
ncbi:MAG TPA: hypothetical protein VEV17_10415 [Bryobacteraceae bacterium]|nr:hypothetical protein [Bryobacteraceae bacterium]